MENNPWQVILIVVLVVASLLSVCFGAPAFFRYQAIENAENTTKVNEITIHQTEQLVKVEQQKAAIREAQAVGIANAQRLINATLTDRYLQHEAIEAQLNMANSPNHTQIYIPVGQNGIPIVKTIESKE